MSPTKLRATWNFQLLVLALVIVAAPVSAQERTTALGGRTVVVWRPSGAENERHPIIVFSHGFGGCATQSRFLTEALAERGYWVFAPNHKDARCGQGGGGARPEEPFGEPADGATGRLPIVATTCAPCCRQSPRHPNTTAWSISTE